MKGGYSPLNYNRSIIVYTRARAGCALVCIPGYVIELY
jgi:hypothetical protein